MSTRTRETAPRGLIALGHQGGPDHSRGAAEEGRTKERARFSDARPLGALLLVAALSAGCGDDSTESPAEGVQIGALLPFTGKLAALGSNVEKALRMAAEQVNDTGGIDGQPVSVVFADEHTDAERGMKSVTGLLREHPVRVVLGPELAALASEVGQLARKRDAVAVLPGLMKPGTDAGESGGVVATSPSTAELGCALGSRIARDNHRDVLILSEDDEFHQILAKDILGPFLDLGRAYRKHGARIVTLPQDSTTSHLEVFTVPSGASIADGRTRRMSLDQVLRSIPDAVVIAAFPERAAELVWLLESMGVSAQYYLSPALNAQDFLGLLPRSALPRLLGLGPTLDAESEFATSFAARWGEQPISEAWFYYDAMMMAVLAAAAAKQNPERSIYEHLGDVSRPPGRLVRASDIKVGLETIREGGEVNYHGLTSPSDVNEQGRLLNGLFILRYWIVEGGLQRPELFVTCRGA